MNASRRQALVLSSFILLSVFAGCSDRDLNGLDVARARIDPVVFETVCEALYGNRFLDVAYKNASGFTTKSRIKPLGLAQQGPRMYLICRFDGYEDNRALAIHRIQQATGSTFTFKRPKDFSLKQYDDDGRFGFGDGKKIRLAFRIKKDYGYHVLESKLSEDQVVKEIGDDYEITATVVDSSMLEWWLRGFGDAVSHVRRSRVRAKS